MCAAYIDSMFSTRQKVWHGLGTIIPNVASSEEAIRYAGLDWTVEQRPIFLDDGTKIMGCYANVRDKDNRPLGIVGDKYKVVQNVDAFAFTDALLGEGVTYETAGSLKDGKIIWLLAKMPETVKVLGDEIEPYLVFTNTHDGSGAVRVTMTSVRVCCFNTLNLAFKKAKRVWSARHTGSVTDKLDDAMQTLQLAQEYIEATKETFEELHKVKMSDTTVYRTIQNIIPIGEDLSEKQKANLKRVSDDILYRFYNAPDLRDRDMTAARLVQAVADTTSHIEPIRRTANYAENHFKATLDGNDLLDKTVGLLLSA